MKERPKSSQSNPEQPTDEVASSPTDYIVFWEETFEPVFDDNA
jgi:hypothetical protein